MPSTPSDIKAARRWLDDIHHHIVLAEQFVQGIDYPTLQSDLRTTYAITRCLEIISEASRRLPATLKARHPSIPWRDMAAAGNIYRHEYEDVAVRAVWDTVKHHLPSLRLAIEHELSTLDHQ